MLLGAIADDLTGATDLSLMLAREGMRTIQVTGIPQAADAFADADAVVIALKSRTIPAGEAVSLSLQACDLLVAAGAEQIMFKYCSTFDSTKDGNIGPVAEALMRKLGISLTIACPAFPQNNRTIYKGHLFVGDELLSDSPMKDHPLTPMRDANLVRVLQAQADARVGLVQYAVVEQGASAISKAFRFAEEKGEQILVIDALTDSHLRTIGEAIADMRLITGGSGIAIGLPENFRRSGKLGDRKGVQRIDAPEGPAIMLAGSCSTATRKQVDVAIGAGVPAMKISPTDIHSGKLSVGEALEWIEKAASTPLLYSSAAPSDVIAAQSILGRETAGGLVEDFLAAVARELKNRGWRRFLVAGGETSGAVVGALGVTALEIGQEIDPGVPWTKSIGDDQPLALGLKSGNFGSDDFFLKAWERL